MMEPMTLIDFDTRFSDFLEAWAQKYPQRFQREEDMEEEAAKAYQAFLDTPAPWLEGASPATFFAQYQDAALLVRWLRAYVQAEECPVPDPLLEQLAALGQEAPILALLREEKAPAEARMIAVDLLRQMESAAPMVDYIRWQVERTQPEELLDNALESLREMGGAVRGPAKIAFTAAGEEGKEALLDILCQYPGDEDVFAYALASFQRKKEKRGLFAGYLAKLEDDRALEALLDVAEGDDVAYIDFIEIRSAIERLGSEAPIRDFTSDPTYQAVQRLQ